MNKENLLRMADYSETIPQERFDVEIFREDNNHNTHECKSVGCTIGHCTILDKYDNVPLFRGLINYVQWSYQFTGISKVSEWEYLFSADWKDVDNTPTGAAKRIRHFVENGLPDNWEEQINGKATLGYV